MNFSNCHLSLICTLILAFFSCGNAGAESVTFDGVDDHIAIGTDTTLATTRFTVETWFKRAAGGTIVLVNTTNFFLGTATDGRLHGEVISTGGSRYSIFSPVAVPKGEWHHGALTYDGTTLRLYLDGAEAASLVLGITVAAGTAETRLGQLVSAGTPYGAFAGQMDEVRIWNHARSGADIALHRDVALTYAPGLLARWGFDGAASATTNSDGANSIAATLANGAAYTADAPLFPRSAPTAAITVPAVPQTVNRGQIVSIQSSAGDADDALVKVEYYSGLTKLGEATKAPFALNWAAGPTGTNTVHAVGVDAAGHRNGSSAGLEIATQLAAGTEAVHFSGAPCVASVPAVAGTAAAQFTVETWFSPETGNGSPFTVGAVGDVTGLVFRGTACSEMNYFLGFRPSDDVLVGGFSSNFVYCLVAGKTPLARGAWHHAAVTFDGAVARLYLNGNLEAQNRFAAQPDLTAQRPLHLGAFAISYDSGNGVSTTAGHFHGVLDEARVWNYARPMEAIRGAQHRLRHPHREHSQRPRRSDSRRTHADRERLICTVGESRDHGPAVGHPLRPRSRRHRHAAARRRLRYLFQRHAFRRKAVVRQRGERHEQREPRGVSQRGSDGFCHRPSRLRLARRQFACDELAARPFAKVSPAPVHRGLSRLPRRRRQRALRIARD